MASADLSRDNAEVVSSPSAGAAPDSRPERPGEPVLRWAAAVAGCTAVTVLRGMRDGGSPWLVQAGDRQVVLRTGQPAFVANFAAEVAGLRLAARAGLPAPVLLGHDLGPALGIPVLLTSCLPGASAIPPVLRPARLHILGAAAARLHAVACPPSPDLPRRDHPIGDCDFAELRAGHELDPLQLEAQALLDRTQPTDGRAVFVHGDLWQGNTLWVGDALSGLVDWDCAGHGAPGVDLGSLRMDAAFSYGPDAADEILAGYEQVAGRAADVAYWDVVAALATPPALGWFPEAIAGQGRPDLTRELLLQRHAGFLGRALDQLR